MKKILKICLKIFLILFAIITIIVIGIGAYIYNEGYKLYNNVTTEKTIDSIVSEIKQKEYFIKINEIPIDYKNAVIAVEDHRFEEHGTIDIISIARAIFTNMKKQDLVEGGSTITQQVAKNMYFIQSKNNTIYRKIAEIIIGSQLEKKYSKDEIFELYMNNIYFGDGYYNIKAAAKRIL